MRLIDADALKDKLQNLAYDDWNQGANTTWANAYGEVAEMVDQEPTADVPEQRWIPVSERLPEKYIGQWLCCTSDGAVMILPYDTPGDGTKECVFYKWDDDGYFYKTFDVIAWMPLPEPWR